MNAKQAVKFAKEGYTLLHLDHVPAIDEDQKLVDFLPLLQRALDAGYQSIMVDGSRLPLDENIAVTAKAAEIAAKYDAGVESGISKINVATEIRQPYEFALEEKPGNIAYAQEKVYDRTRWVMREFLRTTGNHDKLK